MLTGAIQTSGVRGIKLKPLERFGEGVTGTGDRIIKEGSNKDTGDFGITFGVGKKPSSRKKAADAYRTKNKPVVLLDLNPFSFSKKNKFHHDWHRISINSTLENETVKYTKNCDSSRWEMIKAELGLELKPWRSSGDHILVCLNNLNGFMLQGNNNENENLFIKIISSIREHSNRPIKIRPHPARRSSFKVIKNKFSNEGGMSFSDTTNVSLEMDLEGAWAAVFYNSGTSTAAILNGIPIFVSKENQPYTSPVANFDLSMIENPQTPEREQWLYNLCYRIWHVKEMASGSPYSSLIKPKLLELLNKSD